MNEALTAPLPIRALMPWSLLMLAGFLTVYLVAFDQGGLSQAGNLVHELFHDGRHLLGVPCH